MGAAASRTTPQTSNLAARTHLPVDSFYVQASYLLTGETRSGTGIVKPQNPFSLKSGKFGLGAWELTGRYSHLDIGSEVFKNGLADPNLWANRVYMTDVGFNWHINQYLKFMFDWEHSDVQQPGSLTRRAAASSPATCSWPGSSSTSESRTRRPPNLDTLPGLERSSPVRAQACRHSNGSPFVLTSRRATRAALRARDRSAFPPRDRCRARG